MPRLNDRNTALREYLVSRYTATTTDLTSLIRRYLVENPNGLNDQTKVYKELLAAAGI